MRRHQIATVVGMLLVAAVASADPPAPPPQSGGRAAHAAGGHASRAARGSGRPLVRTPPVVVPFPSIATLSGPLPAGLNPPLVPPSRDLYRVHGPFRTGGGYFYPGFVYGPSPDMSTPDEGAAPPAPPVVPTGFLRLDVVPGSAQVYVDGYYAGTVDDVERQHGLPLAEGPHRVEIRAAGYEQATFDVRIVAHDAVTYRAALDTAKPAAPAAVRKGASTIYVIPGCYMGNVPPRADRVGPGCDVKRAHVVSPAGATAGAPH